MSPGLRAPGTAAPGLRAMGLCALAALTPLAASGGGAPSVPPPAGQVSAECAAPVYATDRLVCDDPVLRALDIEVARLWARAEAGLRADETARRVQSDWFGRRSLCAFETDHRACAQRSYRSRIAALQALLDGE